MFLKSQWFDFKVSSQCHNTANEQMTDWLVVRKRRTCSKGKYTGKVYGGKRKER